MRAIDIELGGMKLPLRYEAANLYALKEHTGKLAIRFVNELVPQHGETPEDVALRCSDVSYIAPLIAAGLAHLPEYESMPPVRLRNKIFSLLDAEAQKRGLPLVVAGAEAIAAITPVLMSAVLPPGRTLQDVVAESEKEEREAAQAEQEAGQKQGPLDDDRPSLAKRSEPSPTGPSS